MFNLQPFAVGPLHTHDGLVPIWVDVWYGVNPTKTTTQGKINSQPIAGRNPAQHLFTLGLVEWVIKCGPQESLRYPISTSNDMHHARPTCPVVEPNDAHQVALGTSVSNTN
jgi:hypothetical protein